MERLLAPPPTVPALSAFRQSRAGVDAAELAPPSFGSLADTSFYGGTRRATRRQKVRLQERQGEPYAPQGDSAAGVWHGAEKYSNSCGRCSGTSTDVVRGSGTAFRGDRGVVQQLMCSGTWGGA